jgi:hypothetical protein
MAAVEAVVHQVNAMAGTDGKMRGGASYQADALCKRIAFMRHAYRQVRRTCQT